MKRICTVFALCAVLLLTGCGSGLEQRWDEFSETVSEADGLSFTAALRAEYEDKSVSFELRYEQSGEECAVTVLSPEELRGVKAVRKDGSGTLKYYGFVIDTGTLDGGLTPVGALPYLVDALRGGYADCFWREGDSTVVRLIPEDGMTVTVWLEEESMTLVYAELASGERVTVFCEIEDWELGISSA